MDKTTLSKIYGTDAVVLEKQEQRYTALINKFTEQFIQDEFILFSTPGRTELSGNHTDHNHGRVLAAAVNLDSIAVAAKNELNSVVLYSEGYDDPFRIDLNQLEVNVEETGTTNALIRGVAARLKQLDCKIGGFNACISSEVLPGSGLSSSASVEVLIGNIFNHLYNDGSVSEETLAKIGQFAENVYFGKPCGLMDQLACAVGGIIAIDFENPEQPQLEKVDFDFDSKNYSLLIVDTGGSHADLTDEYAAVPKEMKEIAAHLGGAVLRDIDEKAFFEQLPDLRSKSGDRAVLRAMHFFSENQRVQKQVDALCKNEFEEFLKLTNASGTSSFKYLQNCFNTRNIEEQGVSLALAMSEQFIGQNITAACRVHGGGFAGTILCLLPDNAVADYKRMMEGVFGKDCVLELKIRSQGCVVL
jgi:galactokinase